MIAPKISNTVDDVLTSLFLVIIYFLVVEEVSVPELLQFSLCVNYICVCRERTSLYISNLSILDMS